MNSIITVGITGGIGTGKSLVCRILHIMGYPVFYSDDAAKSIVNQDRKAITEIKKLFGNEAYRESQLNQKYISEQVFKKPEMLDALNVIVHPKVRAAFNNWRSQQKSTIVFNEAAILFETGAFKNNDFNVLITSPLALRKSRLKASRQMSDEQIEQRISNQWSDEKKIPLADFVVSNDEKNLLVPQIEQVLSSLKK